ncbi:magnesium transporter [Pseudoflavonifractor sp. BIOML-A6]|nr:MULTISPECIES: magnesium transporter [unclassified Pseudoflavonifractor]MTQ95471.1 magnesium transporter [Pseudoflavonifractor sp. BIOML-A16]MTR05351.1 magnesium transporter [Pseudoflavonifractor sp. BIOML-A15]MTR31360.1 magnesium transporter [Pseudoflavonifractor sp. BIOML-A14]MTR73229.1 magnesium transporter [Pseudoflavonifractor sp. BIOML-A18]MTS63959.1 magnesium transporter [Pseudoflavonifractor sp. BIOML-A5]MTS71959.1 magnesium transporter [Pseudoflavonifractor sp. BIOML-A8]MTS89658.1
MEKNQFEALRELTERRDYRALRTALAEENEVDIAEFIEALPEEKATVAFRTLPKKLAAEVFSNLPPETQQVIIMSVTDRELSAIVEDLFVDDAVDMLEELPANVVRRVLKNAHPDTRKLINQFLNYPENSVGSIMTAEFMDLKKSMTVEAAIKHIRRTGEESESIYTCYVTDASRRLEGVLTVKELLLAGDEEIVADLMETDLITAETTEDREEAVARMMKYDFITMPVVDRENRLVGIVTVDDVMDVMEEEATEDFEKMAAIAPSEKPYLKTSAFSLAKHRIVWLLVLMISGMITGGILGRYEAAFAAMPLLVTFIPMLTDTGGNAGSQSSTLIIRGMAVGEIGPRDFFKVLWKELRVSLMVGAALSAVNYVRLILMYPGNEMTALTVALALFVTVLLAKTIGGILPMAAKLVHADPAIMAAPLITTIVDAISLVVYFNIACALLPI